jgi:hypothetical protein
MMGTSPLGAAGSMITTLSLRTECNTAWARRPYRCSHGRVLPCMPHHTAPQDVPQRHTGGSGPRLGDLTDASRT